MNVPSDSLTSLTSVLGTGIATLTSPTSLTTTLVKSSFMTMMCIVEPPRYTLPMAIRRGGTY